MKKLVIVTLILALILPAIALADLPDVSGMTDQELKDMINAASTELMARNTTEPEGTLLYEYDGISLYQTGDAYIKRGYIHVPAVMINNRSQSSHIDMENVVCNGWECSGSIGTYVSENAKKRVEIEINVNDANITSLDEIESLKFKWTVGENYMFINKEESEEHRFW